jgi:hypothetical protein
MKTNTIRYGLPLLISLLWVLGMSGPVFAQNNVGAIQKKLSVLVDQNKNASPKVKQFIKAKLLPELSNSVIVNAINAQNARGMTLDEIRKIDAEWSTAEDELDIHKQMMTGTCANQVKSLAAKLGTIGEAFVMDNQGANVCQNELTSDYWQGDEDKWKNSFNNGAGGIDIGTEKLDRSSNMVLQQVSLPVVDKSGKVIGAICYGIKTEKL